MNWVYYVYAFDRSEKIITTALSCLCERMAKKACRYAKVSVGVNTGDYHDGFVFGVAEIRKHNPALGTMNLGGMPSCVSIIYPTFWWAKENRYWTESEIFYISDFEFAEAVTKKIIHTGNHNQSGIDIQFILHAHAIISDTNASATLTLASQKQIAGSPSQIKAAHNVPHESDTASPIFIAAHAEKKLKKSAMELYNEGKPLSEPDGFVLEDVDTDAEQKLFRAQYNAGLALQYADDVDKWHCISNLKYNGKGWADIARKKLERDVEDKRIPSFRKKDVDNLARNIQNQVESLRENLGITEGKNDEIS